MPEQNLTVKFKQEGAEQVQRTVQGLEQAFDALGGAAKRTEASFADAFKRAQALSQIREAYGTVAGREFRPPGEATAGIQGLLTQVQQLRTAFQTGETAAAGMGGGLNLIGAAASLAANPLTVITIGVGAFAAGLKIAAAEAERTFMQIRQLQTLAGGTERETSAMARSFESAGIDAGTLSVALFRVSNEVETGGKNLARYGVSVRDVDGSLKSNQQILLESLRQIGQLGDKSQQGAALLQLYGRAGREMALALAEGSTSMEELYQVELKRTAVTPGLMKATSDYNKATSDLSNSWRDLKLQVAENLALPVLTTLTSWTSAAMKFVRAIDPTAIGARAGQALGDVLFGPAPMQRAKEAEATAQRRTDYEIALTEQRLRMEEDADRKMRQIDTMRAADRIKTITGSEAAALQTRLRAFDQEEQAATQHYNQMIALEMERVGKEGTISEEFILKANKELRDRQLAITAERNQLQSSLDKSRAQESAQILDDQVRRTKAASDQQVMILQSQKEQELAILDTSNRDEISKASERERVEVDTAMRIRDARMSQLDSEIAGQRRLAQQYPANFELQRSIENKILELQQQRVQVENQTNSAVLQSRSALVKQLNSLAQQEAQIGRSLLDTAISRAEQLGRTTISLISAGADLERAWERAQKTLDKLAAGMAVPIADLREAMSLAAMGQQMQQFGAGGAPGGFLGANVQQALEQLRPGGPAGPQVPGGMGGGSVADAWAAAREAATRAWGDQQPMGVPTAPGDVTELAAKNVQISEDSLGRINATVGQAVDRLVPEVLQSAFDTFTDKLIRKLEFEAARA